MGFGNKKMAPLKQHYNALIMRLFYIVTILEPQKSTNMKISQYGIVKMSEYGSVYWNKEVI